MLTYGNLIITLLARLIRTQLWPMYFITPAA